MIPRRVMIVAGEASGDLHGARLVEAMSRRSRNLEFFGVGGKAMRAAGVSVEVEASRLSVVGLTEVIGRFPDLRRGLSAAKGWLRERRPDLLILIDFPDFNLHLAACARRLGIPVLYYIGPQIWAWRSGRVRKVRDRVRHMAVILPFEERFYRRHGVPATFVGHPLMDGTLPPVDEDFSRRLRGENRKERPDQRPNKRPDQRPNQRWIGLLPGSRRGEIERILPVLRDAAERMAAADPTLAFAVSVSDSVEMDHVASILARAADPGRFELVGGGVHRVLERACLTVSASGTVTLEGALAGVPMIVVYRVSPISYHLGRALIRVPFVSLVNLIAGREVVPELLQDAAAPEAVARLAGRLLADEPALLRMRADLLEVRKRMGPPGASERVAGIALDLLSGI